MTSRKLQGVIESVAASDGAGVKLRRSIGQAGGPAHDPFLMLDEFSSDEPGRLHRGLPCASASRLRDRHLPARRPHAARGPPRQPRRPQERRRAMDDRGPRHHPFRDAAADRGPHARLPALDQPAGERKDEARGVSRHLRRRRFRTVALAGGGEIRVIAGDFAQDGVRTAGPIGGLSTQPLYYDVRLPDIGRQ